MRALHSHTSHHSDRVVEGAVIRVVACWHIKRKRKGRAAWSHGAAVPKAARRAAGATGRGVDDGSNVVPRDRITHADRLVGRAKDKVLFLNRERGATGWYRQTGN